MSSSSDRRLADERRERRVFAVVVTVIAGAVAAGGAAAFEIDSRQYGLVLFVAVPYFIGFFSTAALRFWGPRTAKTCYTVAGAAGLVLATGFLLMGKEGLVCIVMAVPLAGPLVLLGAYSGYALLHERALLSAAGATLLLLLALGAAMGVERRYPLTAATYIVTDSVSISAPSAVVWNSLISMGSLGQPKDFLFRVGVACPQRVDIYGQGKGAMRVCTLSTGLLHELITTWEPGRRLQWTSLTTPAPLKELNPFREATPPHLHGFYRSVGGEFELLQDGPTTTRVIRRSSYQHHMFPAWYWRVWCDYVAHRGHVYVLGVLKDSVEHHVASADLQAQR